MKLGRIYRVSNTQYDTMGPLQTVDFLQKTSKIQFLMPHFPVKERTEWWYLGWKEKYSWLTLSKVELVRPFCFELPMPGIIWHRNFHTWATAQKLWHHFWEVQRKILWTYFLKLPCIAYCTAPQNIHELLARINADCASIFPTQSKHGALKIWWDCVFVRFPNSYQTVWIPRVIQKKERVYQLGDTTWICLIQIEGMTCFFSLFLREYLISF